MCTAGVGGRNRQDTHQSQPAGWGGNVYLLFSESKKKKGGARVECCTMPPSVCEFVAAQNLRKKGIKESFSFATLRPSLEEFFTLVTSLPAIFIPQRLTGFWFRNCISPLIYISASFRWKMLRNVRNPPLSFFVIFPRVFRSAQSHEDRPFACAFRVALPSPQPNFEISPSLCRRRKGKGKVVLSVCRSFTGSRKREGLERLNTHANGRHASLDQKVHRKRTPKHTHTHTIFF